MYAGPVEATEPTNTPTNTPGPQATTATLHAAQLHPMASLLSALLSASKHTPRSPANLLAWVTHATPASALALADKESLPPDTLNSSKHATTLTRVSTEAHATAGFINVAAAQVQPTQQQRKYANRVRNGGAAGAGAAHGTHHVDAPRAHQHQPSPSSDAHTSHPTCRSQVSAQALPHTPASTQTQPEKRTSPPVPKPLARAARRWPLQLANLEAAKAANRSAAAPCHHPNVPAATWLVAQLLAEKAALLCVATRAPRNRPISRARALCEHRRTSTTGQPWVAGSKQRAQHMPRGRFRAMVADAANCAAAAGAGVRHSPVRS